jgi:biopolymer transport protein ExbD
MHLRLPSTARLGIFFLLLASAMYFGPIRWVETRKFVVVNMPVSLKPGHIRAHAFKINLKGTYFIEISLHGTDDWGFTGCLLDERVKPRWILSTQDLSSGDPSPSGQTQIAGTYESDGFSDTYFDAAPGTYTLDSDISPGAECLDQLSPTLIVETHKDEYRDAFHLICLVFLVLAGTGTVLLIRPAIALTRERLTIVQRKKFAIFIPSGHVYRPPLRKLRPSPIFFRPPDFGMVFAVAILPPCLLFMVLVLHVFNLPRMGISVPLTMAKDTSMLTDSRAEGFLVWLDDHGNYFLNSKQAPREHLQQAIQDELAKRAEWTVYFEAAPNAKFQDAAFAMDAIQSAHGKLVWLTPAARALLSRPYP